MGDMITSTIISSLARAVSGSTSEEEKAIAVVPQDPTDGSVGVVRQIFRAASLRRLNEASAMRSRVISLFLSSPFTSMRRSSKRAHSIHVRVQEFRTAVMT